MLISFKSNVVVAQETRIWVSVNIEEIFVEWICGCVHTHTHTEVSMHGIKILEEYI